ncbi:MAG TPA: methyltransferase domain-containing protein [Solirubrobacteraceae bacterium]|nr:methyltransferase domain-containing protein [Solirubrobacteraceae bacterium]
MDGDETTERGARPQATERDAQRFSGLRYEDFRRMARDESLSDAERVGFPDGYRAGREEAILADVASKLPALTEHGRVIADVGCGASGLPFLLREHCRRQGHTLLLIDAPEMLEHHEDGPGVVKVPGRFPAETAERLAEWRGRVDAAVAYSVLQVVYGEANPIEFVDAAAELLAPGGRLLIGDLPNASMRRRFLASAAGAAHHRAYTGRDEDPPVAFNTPSRGEVDDALVLGLAARARAAGLHAWVVPQHPSLPMANRREDLLVARP